MLEPEDELTEPDDVEMAELLELSSSEDEDVEVEVEVDVEVDAELELELFAEVESGLPGIVWALT